MPKTYLTLEERQKAEIKKREERQNRELRALLHDKVYRKLTYDVIKLKTGLGFNTIGKVVNHPENATVAQLRAVCAAAGIELTISAE